MAIRDFERYHGAAIIRAVKVLGGEASLQILDDLSAGCYLISGNAFMVKYASDRMSPWKFNFNADHRQSLSLLLRRYGDANVILVCRDDSLFVISSSEVDSLLGPSPEPGIITISRRPRHMATVRSSSAELSNKLADSDFLRIIDDK